MLRLFGEGEDERDIGSLGSVAFWDDEGDVVADLLFFCFGRPSSPNNGLDQEEWNREVLNWSMLSIDIYLFVSRQVDISIYDLIKTLPSLDNFFRPFGRPSQVISKKELHRSSW